MFCTECGADNTDQAKNCSNCGHSFESGSSPLSPQPLGQSFNSQTSSIDEGGGFFSKLIWQNKYTTARAKWFYQTAEKIINIVVWIAIAIGVAVSLYFMTQGLDGIYVGILNFGSEIYSFFFTFIYLIFAKLLLMAVGALIRITELLEMDRRF